MHKRLKVGSHIHVTLEKQVVHLDTITMNIHGAKNAFAMELHRISHNKNGKS